MESDGFLLVDGKWLPIITYEEKCLDGKRVGAVYLVMTKKGKYRVVKYMLKHRIWTPIINLKYKHWPVAEAVFQSLVKDFYDPECDRYYR